METCLNKVLTKKRISFAPPRIDQKIIDAVSETLKSGWITTGAKTKLFEKKIADYIKSPKVLCINSATAGLELALKWFGVKEGDEVILPAYTYSATANVVIHQGAKPVFVDVNIDDFNISVDAIRKAITDKTKVIIPVDFGGYPCDYDQINQLVNENEILSYFSSSNDIQQQLGRILVLSDSAHSIGSIYNNQKLGTVADFNVFSFHAVKNITTAEGGAISFGLPAPFDNEAIYNYFSINSLHGQTIDAQKKIIENNWKYDVIMPGYKKNMPDVLASIGLVEIERYDETLAKRKNVFEAYSEGFKDCNWALLPIYKNEQKESSYHIYALRVKGIDEKRRDELIKNILNQGVSVNVHFQPVPMFSYYKQLGYKVSDYPNAYANYAAEISLPVYFDLTDYQIEYIIEIVKNSVKEVLGK
ncbi:MAG: DegT/DnrJ/EryC1/StrS family aminotransferase [Bacteroidales bacterium]|nr:DegT/DnrJ/EryC1/StrS family aminotransferase [Bacteroidales bacterium]